MSTDSIITHSETAIPIILISQQEFANDALAQRLSKMSGSQLTWLQQWLNSLDFSAQDGEVALCPDASGNIQCVIAAYQPPVTDDVLAKIIDALPAADYLLAEPHPLDEAEWQNAIIYWATHQYRFERYKKQQIPLRRLVIDAEHYPQCDAIIQAIFTTRDLINTPTQDMGPAQMASFMQIMSEQYQAKFQQIVGDELLAQRFPCIHAVGRASSQAPRLLEMTWGDESLPKVTLVGKGVCFDTGGLDLKPASGMRYMKKDMGGAAHVLGLAQCIMQSKLAIHLRVLIPAVENAVAGNAYRPGDVLTTRQGITVEIDNTDAEGRLVMCDAISYACEQHPDYLIDFSTLTGAARVAVGTDIAAMFVNDDDFAANIEHSAKKTGDMVWRLPLYAPYKSMLKSSIADISNSANSGYAGAITAALYLQEFVQDVAWCHFDVMAYNLSAKPGKPEGGEALGLRAMFDVLLNKFA